MYQHIPETYTFETHTYTKQKYCTLYTYSITKCQYIIYIYIICDVYLCVENPVLKPQNNWGPNCVVANCLRPADGVWFDVPASCLWLVCWRVRKRDLNHLHIEIWHAQSKDILVFVSGHEPLLNLIMSLFIFMSEKWLLPKTIHHQTVKYW